MTRFESLWNAWHWNPIRNCPGRYTLVPSPSSSTIEDLLGAEVDVCEYAVTGVRDPVFVGLLADGAGIISYAKAGGLFVHTLNTPAGMQRKLASLGIEPAAVGNR
ncbi:MAG: hypothetical protein RR704_04615 [Stenotrophomonas sp.]